MSFFNLWALRGASDSRDSNRTSRNRPILDSESPIQGDWHQEILPLPEIEASFLHTFSYPPLEEG